MLRFIEEEDEREMWKIGEASTFNKILLMFRSNMPIMEAIIKETGFKLVKSNR
jgi:hypothetical protein